MAQYEFHALGKDVRTPVRRLETFEVAPGVDWVSLESDEVTANCPVTGQPDWYTVNIAFQPNGLAIESKSLKLYLQSFRNDGIFCEAFADLIAHDVFEAVQAKYVRVTVKQKPRGGITIRATASRGTPQRKGGAAEITQFDESGQALAGGAVS